MDLVAAFALPPSLKAELAPLRGPPAQARWPPLAHNPLILRSIGKITDRFLLEEIHRALSRLSWEPFPLCLTGAFLHEGKAQDRLSVGISPPPSLRHLQKQIERRLREAGLPPEKKRFQPFLTLGFADPAERKASAAWLQTHNLFRSRETTLSHVTLFERVTSEDDRLYVSRAEYGYSPDLPLPEDDAF